MERSSPSTTRVLAEGSLRWAPWTDDWFTPKFLIRTPGDDHLAGGGANDVLYGNAGNDRLEGGPGDDQLYGDDSIDWPAGGTADGGSDYLDGGHRRRPAVRPVGQRPADVLEDEHQVTAAVVDQRVAVLDHEVVAEHLVGINWL